MGDASYHGRLRCHAIDIVLFGGKGQDMSETEPRAAALRECPFCGSEPIKVHHEPHDHPLLKRMGIDWPDHHGSFTIECPGCSVGMIHESDTQVTQAWNRRAALSAQAREQQPVSWMRKWAFDGEEPTEEMGPKGLMRLPMRFKLLPVTRHKILADDIPLYAAPVSAEAILDPNPFRGDGLPNDMPHHIAQPVTSDEARDKDAGT